MSSSRLARPANGGRRQICHILDPLVYPPEVALWIAYPCHPLPEGELGRMRDCPTAGCYSPGPALSEITRHAARLAWPSANKVVHYSVVERTLGWIVGKPSQNGFARIWK